MTWTTILTGMKLLVQLLGWLQSRGYIEQGRREERAAQLAAIFRDITVAAGVESQVRVMSDEEVDNTLEANSWYRD